MKSKIIVQDQKISIIKEMYNSGFNSPELEGIKNKARCYSRTYLYKDIKNIL